MDRLTAFVAISHLKLRLQYLSQHPELLEGIMDKRPPLTIPRPVELAGMRSRVMRAQQQQKSLAKTGEEYDAVMDGIDEAHAAITGHVGDLTGVMSQLRSTIEGMVEKSNGGPIDGESDGRQLPSDQGGEGVESQSPQPEQLTVNGVSKV